MGWKYLAGKSWAEVTRDERFFCQHLYNLIRNDVPRFVSKLNELCALTMPLPVDEDWEVGFEVCFYRDHRFMCEKEKHGWHGDETRYSPKRTFDLCLFSHDHIVIIEAKAQQGFDQQQMAEFKKDREWVSYATEVVKDTHGMGHCVDVKVVALASDNYLKKLKWDDFNSSAVFSGQPLSWRQLAACYPGEDEHPDAVLLRADAIYEEARSGGENNHGYQRGKDLVAYPQPEGVRFVGRNGGIKGKLFHRDLETGQWETQLYETSASSIRPNQNWFSIEEFVAVVSVVQAGRPDTL